MDSSWPENLCPDRKRAIQELIRGRESANELRVILGEPFGADELVAAEDLVSNIMGSFSKTISILNLGTTDEVQNPANTRAVSPCWDGRKSEDSQGSSKTSGLKQRRGCYKRRKTSEARIRVTPTINNDGHAWRKYGQKIILNAKHPRNYYRCTHKFDQGCLATKQVQRTEDDPPMYRTTYNGYHTCTNLVKAPQMSQIFLDSTTRDSSVLLSFGSDSHYPNTKSHEPYFPGFPQIKQEYKEEEEEEKPSLNHNQSFSSSDYLLSPDLTTFESSGLMTMLSSATGSEHGDVISSGMYSCTARPHSHGLDLDIVGGVDFEDVLEFEFENC